MSNYLEKGHLVRFGECVYCNAQLIKEKDQGRIEEQCPGELAKASDDWGIYDDDETEASVALPTDKESNND